MNLDPVSEKLVIGGVGVSLSRTEFSMLYALAKSAGNVVPPSDLIGMSWDGEPAPNASSVDVTIYRLRRKLARTPAGKGVVQHGSRQGLHVGAAQPGREPEHSRVDSRPERAAGTRPAIPGCHRAAFCHLRIPRNRASDFGF